MKRLARTAEHALWRTTINAAQAAVIAPIARMNGATIAKCAWNAHRQSSYTARNAETVLRIIRLVPAAAVFAANVRTNGAATAACA